MEKRKPGTSNLEVSALGFGCTGLSFGYGARWHSRRGGSVGALLMGPDGAFITGSDILMDGGVTATYWYGDLAPQ